MASIGGDERRASESEQQMPRTAMRDIAIDKLGSDARRATLSSTGYGSNCKVKMIGFFGWYMRCITENSQRNQIEKPIAFFPKDCMRRRLSLERADLSRNAAPRAAAPPRCSCRWCPRVRARSVDGRTALLFNQDG